MIIKINLNNCNLYIGNIMKCTYFQKFEGLKIIHGELYKKDVVLISMLADKYITLDDYVKNNDECIKLRPADINDLYLDLNSLSRADKSILGDKLVKIKKK